MATDCWSASRRTQCSRPAGMYWDSSHLGTKARIFIAGCNDVPDDAHNRFGIRPNDQGFINEFEDAVRVVEYMKETGAEPAIWEPWLVVQYPNDPLSVS